MFANHFISDAAVFAPQSHRGPDGLEASQAKAEGRKSGLLASLRGLFVGHGPQPASRGYSR